MKLLLLKKIYDYRKYILYFLLLLFLIMIEGASAFVKSEKDIPAEILPILQSVAKEKNVDLLKLAGAIKSRTNYGRFDFSSLNKTFNIPTEVFKKINLNLFQLENIFKLPKFDVKNFTFVNGEQKFYGFMLLSEEDIKSYGNLNPYSYIDSVKMYAEKMKDKIGSSIKDNLPHGLPTCCVITQRFMQRYPDLIIRSIPGIFPFHTGVDIADSPYKTTNVYSTMNGTVKIGESSCGGKYIMIKNPEYEVYYGHLSQILVQNGQTVTPQKLIGIQGNTGSCTTGKHTHYEVKHRGMLIDPESFK